MNKALFLVTIMVFSIGKTPSVLAQPATPKPTVMQVVHDACLPVETQKYKEDGSDHPEQVAEMFCRMIAGICFRGKAEPDEFCRRGLAKYELGRNAEGNSLLNEAAYIGDRRLVEAMIRIGVDVDYPARGLADIAPVGSAWTPIMLAAAEGHEEIVSMLIQGGADVNAKNELGRTSLMFSANYGFFEIAEMLLENGASTDDVANDETGWTAIIAASFNGHRNLVRLLLEHGADQNIRDTSGKTALMWAEEQGHRRVARTLERSQ